jgi:hypothetical protein
MFRRLKRLFKRKKYAPVYPAGGYPTPTDLRNRARSGEYVINTKQQEAFTAHKRVMFALKEMEDKEVAVTEEEVREAVVNALGDGFRYLQEKMKHSTTNCPNCGAPLHGHKCDYCGTEQ